MKVQMLLKPLAIVIAASLANVALADQPRGNKDADATIVDSQTVEDNTVNNQMTINNATINGGSVSDVEGNVGVNVVAGDNNQQANAAVLASADASFVFGTATASIDVDQSGSGNTLNNASVPNYAQVSNAIYSTSGNIGVNVAAGNFNQQKNDMAAAVAGGAAVASSDTSQELSGNLTNNAAQLDMGESSQTVQVTMTGTYDGTSSQSNDVYPEVWSGGDHPDGGDQVGHIDFDNEGVNDGRFEFDETGDISLAGTVTTTNTVVTSITPVSNNANLNTALYGVSGNVGVNIAAGGGNQQSNSLAIAAACNSCGSSTGGGSNGQ